MSENELQAGSDKPKRLFNSISHPKKRAFLVSVSNLFSIAKAARAVGIDRTYHYYWLRHDPEKQYAGAFDLARQMAVDMMEDEA